MNEIKRIGVLSMAKIYGLTMAILGLIIGIFVGFIMFFIGTFVGTENHFSRFLGPGLGIVGFIFMPILYGILGLIFGGFAALIYNLLASWVGGIEVELEEKEDILKL
jgi:ABC-type antimicrobial peptide transport system permease subunit